MLLLCKIMYMTLMVTHVDVIELNHYYSEDKLIFDQVVMWEWSEEYGRYIIMDWKLYKPENGDSLDTNAFYYQKEEKLYKIVGKHFRETWTNFDVELENRSFIPVNKRTGIIGFH